ncbi:Eco57I restriction-modification methylase domain-containing protein [Arthrobacter sp. TmT3-37]
MSSRRIDLVNAGDFRTLFIEELLWNQPDLQPLKIEVERNHYTLSQVAGFSGLRVWLCAELPDRRTQRLIDKEVRKASSERLLIFAGNHRQDWSWLQSPDAEGAGQPRLVRHQHFVGSDNAALDQRLQMISIGFDENVNLIDVLRKMRSAFDAEQVTRKFYNQFIDKQRALALAINGIFDQKDRDWYSALMMNRLMFIYFMQRKLFMDSDPNYLRNRLHDIRALNGEGSFYEFYRDFLIPLFHSGLGDPDHKFEDPAIAKLVGDVRYINGGIFAHHELECANEIKISDDVFEEIFVLFDSYQWHLDDRESANQNEINPDVLGYIFEQFINQKQQGAYYTKEDVTHYMTTATLLPVVLERLQAVADGSPWDLLAADPDRYVWNSLGLGADLDFPADIEEERSDKSRPNWGAIAPEKFGLPGESWWEVDARREAHRAVLSGLAAGMVSSVDEAVTANVDLETLTIDYLDLIQSPAQVVAAWKVLSEIRVVDPTCGSGAFLFAALKVLSPLYSAVIDAAHAVNNGSHPALNELIADIEKHPNAEYFLLKHASLHNLYGVDIMKEAVEVARLRLFLKLVATIDDKEKLEPLPDLEFNIKPGNILVGALNAAEIEDFSADLFSGLEASKVAASASRISSAFALFRTAQEAGLDEEARSLRSELTALLDEVRLEVNQQYFLALPSRDKDFDGWVESHTPFHWFIEFPEVFDRGGFDVVIGNPPYIAKGKITDYRYRGFQTNDLPDIYAPCSERAAQITNSSGRFALIVPISSVFGADYALLRKFLEKRFATVWASSFSRNPAALFSAGLGVRSTILIGAKTSTGFTLFATKTHRWYDAYRPSLFENLQYIELESMMKSSFGWIRPANDEFLSILTKLSAVPGTVGSVTRQHGKASVGFKQTALYWLSVFLQDPPAYEQDGTPTPQTKIGRLKVDNDDAAFLTLGVLASKLAFVWWYSTGDDFDVTVEGLKSTPIDPQRLSEPSRAAIIAAARDLVEDFPNHEMYTNYAKKLMGTVVLSEMRDITDRIDLVLAREFGYEDLLPKLEHAYACAYKPTGDRPGTQRVNPFA